MNNIKCIFFDLDNTIWDFSRSSEIALEEVFSMYGLISEFKNYLIFKKIYSFHNTRLWNKYYNTNISREDLLIDRFKFTLKERGINDIDFAIDINNSYMDLCYQHTKLFKGVINNLNKFNQKGIVCSAISNGFDDVQNKKLLKCNIREQFTNIYCSESIGICKPHKEIFNFACKEEGYKEENCLMVGDNFEIDIKGALKAGLHASWFCPPNNKIPQNIVDFKTEHLSNNSINSLDIINSFYDIKL